MKKITFVAILMLCLGFIMSSCTKKDDTPKLDDRLVGTKWQCSDAAAKLLYGGNNRYQVFEFISTTEVERYSTNNGAVVDSDGVFSYTLNYPSITINKAGFTFTDSRTMVRDGTDGKGYYAKYIRQ